MPPYSYQTHSHILSIDKCLSCQPKWYHKCQLPKSPLDTLKAHFICLLIKKDQCPSVQCICSLTVCNADTVISIVIHRAGLLLQLASKLRPSSLSRGSCATQICLVCRRWIWTEMVSGGVASKNGDLVAAKQPSWHPEGCRTSGGNADNYHCVAANFDT